MAASSVTAPCNPGYFSLIFVYSHDGHLSPMQKQIQFPSGSFPSPSLRGFSFFTRV